MWLNSRIKDQELSGYPEFGHTEMENGHNEILAESPIIWRTISQIRK